ncbi:MAG: hypothetical protein JNL83_10315 [Myxococcales bacterium]|nr:hypothetical protein [Myxococcales bacterium]
MRVVGALLTAVLSSGCATYTVYARTYGDGARGETMAILTGVEAAAGVAIGIGYAIHNRREGSWYENAAVGFLVPFVVDVAIALGVGTSDFVGE